MRRRFLVAALMASAALSAARTLRAQSSPPPFSPEQLDQMLAPIALYPDALQSQVLMAATYPLEVVEAARWSRAHPGLKGNAAVDAVQGQDWDVSVKSLIAFPQVLAMMDEHLDWTQNLGNAVLAQQQDVADSIQRLRAQAAAAGNLNNTGPLKIEYLGAAPDQTIIIEPVDPNVIYVPYYDPVWVYGRWRYPAYPPYYWRPLPVYGYGPVLAVGFMFGVGIAASFALFGGWHWARHDCYINIVHVDRVVRIDPHFDRARVSNGVWVHDADHRRGVPYRDAATRTRFGQGGQAVDQRQQFRGRTETAPGGGPGPRQANLPQANVRPSTPQTVGPQVHGPQTPTPQTRVPQAPTPPGRITQPSAQPPARVYAPQRGGAINGVDRGPQVNRESARGNAQVQHMATPPQQHPAPSRPSSGPPSGPKGGGRK